MKKNVVSMLVSWAALGTLAIPATAQSPCGVFETCLHAQALIDSARGGLTFQENYATAGKVTAEVIQALNFNTRIWTNTEVRTGRIYTLARAFVAADPGEGNHASALALGDYNIYDLVFSSLDSGLPLDPNNTGTITVRLRLPVYGGVQLPTRRDPLEVRVRAIGSFVGVNVLLRENGHSGAQVYSGVSGILASGEFAEIGVLGEPPEPMFFDVPLDTPMQLRVVFVSSIGASAFGSPTQAQWTSVTVIGGVRAPHFELPEGYTVNSPALGIVNGQSTKSKAEVSSESDDEPGDEPAEPADGPSERILDFDLDGMAILFGDWPSELDDLRRWADRRQAFLLTTEQHAEPSVGVGSWEKTRSAIESLVPSERRTSK